MENPKEETTISEEAKQRAKNYMSLKGALELKQETLEEAFSNYVNEKYHSPTQGSTPDLESAKFGAKWQSERMYSEEEVLELILKSKIETSNLYYEDMKEWFEKFKKK